jgi:uncharacterized protein YndB with AHSA1/START domain
LTSSNICTVRLSRPFDASPERAFDDWLNPATAGRWLFATPTGQMVRLEIDARPGGKFLIVERRDGEDVEHLGEYIKVDRPRRLAFSFTVPRYSPLATRVDIEIAPAGAGCELTLTHEGVLEEWANSTEAGWKSILDGLASSLEQNQG